MTDLHTIRTACHVAVLHAMQGYGALVLPDPATDMPDPLGGPSLHATDWAAMLCLLASYGTEPDVDDDGDMMREAGTGDREVIVLVMDPVTTDFDPADFMAARTDVLAAALA